MDYPLGMAFVLAVAIASAGLLLWLAARTRRRNAIVRSAVLIGSAMDRHGITPADAEAAGLADGLFAAAKRCAECPSAGPCRAWLLASRGKPFASHCPNLEMFQSIQRYRETTQR